MIQETQVQQTFFTNLKNYLPSHISLVDELVELMNLSHDSVYRRVRGEKPISLAEIKLICNRFNVSVDAMLQLNGNAVVFYKPPLQKEADDFSDYLNGMLKQIKYFSSFQQKQMYYLCKDVPVFYFFLFPEIAAFKTFFWMKSVLNKPELSHVSFNLDEHKFEDCYKVGQQIIQEYNQIPSIEIWNIESFTSTINQIEYYRDAGCFENPSDLKAVAASFEKLLDYLQAQATKGRKLSLKGDHLPVKLEFYLNAIIMGSNTILLELDGSKITILTYSVLKYLMTRDDAVCTEAFQSFDNLKNRSLLISQSGEKERLKFFNTLKQRVKKLAA